jgi:hypothetical protein
MKILHCIWLQCLGYFEPQLTFYFSSNILIITWFLSFVSHTSPCLSQLLLNCVVVTEGMMTSMMWLPWVVWTWLRRPREYWAPQNLLGHRYGPVKTKFSFMLCLYNIKLGKLVSSSKLECPLCASASECHTDNKSLMHYVCHSCSLCWRCLSFPLGLDALCNYLLPSSSFCNLLLICLSYPFSLFYVFSHFDSLHYCWPSTIQPMSWEECG